MEAMRARTVPRDRRSCSCAQRRSGERAVQANEFEQLEGSMGVGRREGERRKSASAYSEVQSSYS